MSLGHRRRSAGLGPDASSGADPIARRALSGAIAWSPYVARNIWRPWCAQNYVAYGSGAGRTSDCLRAQRARLGSCSPAKPSTVAIVLAGLPNDHEAATKPVWADVASDGGRADHAACPRRLVGLSVPLAAARAGALQVVAARCRAVPRASIESVGGEASVNRSRGGQGRSAMVAPL